MSPRSDNPSTAVDEWYESSRSNGSAPLSHGGTTNLADLLERILDKGVVVAGDISISLVDVELLTIKLRLLIASVDKAREMGINWWESDPWLTTTSERSEKSLEPGGSSSKELEGRFEKLEQAVGRLTDALEPKREHDRTSRGDRS
jgi:hypothetical protein